MRILLSAFFGSAGRAASIACERGHGSAAITAAPASASICRQTARTRRGGAAPSMAGRLCIGAHPHHQLGGAHDAVQVWCRANNHPITGLSWEVYGDWEEDPQKLQTEVFYLLR